MRLCDALLSIIRKQYLSSIPIIIMLLCQSSLGIAKDSPALQAKDVPFWARSEGYWLNQATYLDEHLEYKIKHYQSIVTIRLDGHKIITEENKFYPPGLFYGKAIGLDIPEDVGVQLNQISVATLVNADGQAKTESALNGQLSPVSLITPFNQDSALLTITPQGAKTDLYRMLITLPTKGSRMLVNLGIQAPDDVKPNGGLRGAAIFNGSRIMSNDVVVIQHKLRLAHHVGALVTADKDGHYSSEILTQPPIHD